MRKSILKTLVLALVVAFAFFGYSCGKHQTPTPDPDPGKQTDPDPDTHTDPDPDTHTDTEYTITYVLNGGTFAGEHTDKYTGKNPVQLPDVSRDGFRFSGWFENADFSGNPVLAIKTGTTGNKTFYAKWDDNSATGYTPKWDFNTLNFDGNGMEVVLKVLPKAEFDPYDSGYTADDKEIKKKQIDLVEAAYNIDIVYSNWDNDAPWGPDRVQFIKDRFTDGSFQKNGVYYVNITSQWIPTLVKAGTLAELYDYGTDSGLFNQVQFGGEYYVQNSTVNESCAVQKKVYGYSTDSARPDYFLYYNSKLISDLNLEDPAELWFKGEWTWSKFDELVNAAQTSLGSNGFAIDCGYAEFAIGAVASQGGKMNNTSTGRTLIASSNVAKVFEKMKAYYQGGQWDKKHGVQDVATNFVAGKNVFHTGSLWFLKESTRFDPNQIDWPIGMVPYPTADTGNTMTPITEPYTYYDTQNNKVKVEEPLVTKTGQVLKTDSGDPIYGLDLSESSFTIPFTGTGCYSIMNYANGANGINSLILFSILHDLIGGLGKNPNIPTQLTADEGYRIYLEKKLDAEIFVDVVMSCQSDQLSYYEVMETLSMTVGNGSHFGPNAFWPLCTSMMTSDDTPQVVLKSVQAIYQAALEELGY